MTKKSATVLLFCVCALGMTGALAADLKVSPPPLAEQARVRPEPNEFDKLDVDHRRDRTRHSVMIGMHDWDALEREYVALEAAYRTKQIDPDEYVRTLRSFAPDNGKIQLADLEHWAKERPASYIAVFTLGLQYQNTAWSERGPGFVWQTSREQFAAMDKYGALAYSTLKRSIPLAKTPIASYVEMIEAAMFVDRPTPDTITLALEIGRAWLASSWIGRTWKLGGPSRTYCPSVVQSGLRFATRYDEQLHYVCVLTAMDPPMSVSVARFLYFQTPRWGGNFEESDRLLQEFEANKRMPETTISILKARLLAQRGMHVLESDPKAAFDYLMNAFETDPRMRNADWLRSALDAAIFGAKDMEAAVRCANKLIAAVPDDAEALAYRGWAYEAMGDHRRYMDDMIAAAMLGKKEAQNNVGYYYMVGQRGLPRDLAQARAWLTLAANQGFQHSRDKLPVVEEMIRKEAAK